MDCVCVGARACLYGVYSVLLKKRVAAVVPTSQFTKVKQKCLKNHPQPKKRKQSDTKLSRDGNFWGQMYKPTEKCTYATFHASFQMYHIYKHQDCA